MRRLAVVRITVSSSDEARWVNYIRETRFDCLLFDRGCKGEGDDNRASPDFLQISLGACSEGTFSIQRSGTDTVVDHYAYF